MKFRLVTSLVFISVLLLSACGKPGIKDEVDWPIKDFSAVNQSNQSFGLKELKGKVWVSDFVFTSCADVCPPMTENLTKLQQKVKAAGLKNVEFVSFSVDPTVDSPERLTNYAKQFHLDFKNWNFLTGYSQQFIETFALKDYKALVKKPQEGNQVIHGTSFYLIDQKGHIRKSYSGYQDVPYNEIIQDIKALQ